MPKSLQSILRTASRNEKKKAQQRKQKLLRRKQSSKSNNSAKNNKKKRKIVNNMNKTKNKSSNPKSFKSTLLKLQQKQQNRKVFKSKQLALKQSKQEQRRHDIYRNRTPKSLEYLRAQKVGNARTIKGFRSKLTILSISYHKQQESNEEDLPFRDSYFAAKINKLSAINRSMEMNKLKEVLGPLAASLPHVLLHKRKIFDTIINFINNEAHRDILRDAVRFVCLPPHLKCLSIILALINK